MNRIVLVAQLLGALVFIVVGGVMAQGPRRPAIGYEVNVDDKTLAIVDGKPMAQGFQADGKRHKLELHVAGNQSLFDLIDTQDPGRRVGSQHHFINLRVGNERFQLRNAVITEVQLPSLYFNPKEFTIDKSFVLELDADIFAFSLDTGQLGGPRTSSTRSFTGNFKGEIVGIEANFTRVRPLVLPLKSGPSGTTNRRGSLKVEMDKLSADRAGWGKAGPGLATSPLPPHNARIVLFDQNKKPLAGWRFHVTQVRSLGFTSAEGRSMSFELMFDTFETSLSAAGPPNRGGGE